MITYYKRDAVQLGARLCLVGGADVGRVARVTNTLPIGQGTTLRTYRLALAATGEYTQAVGGGTVGGALAAMATTMNRVNGIYERNVSVRLTMVANNNLIVYTNPLNQPYSNGNGVAMLGQNQLTLDAVIGSANYDIGHVFSTGGGGVAGLRVPCIDGSKALGVTGLTNPTGDVFDVDFVSHEIGHQFGGNHTFNGLTESCGGGNRSGSTAYEPGSGSTIMAYAGICGAENLQPNSDDHFHIESLSEITAFINNGSTGGSCPVATATGNTVPTVNAGTDYTIPKGTPFELTATGSDGDGHMLTYGWEEYDLGAAAPPNTDDLASRPIFRSLSPVTSRTRTFPSLTYVLNDANTPPETYTCAASTCLTGESLPTRTRDMTFQVTARDNQAAGGGVVSDAMVVSVDGGSGPFALTAPNSRPARGLREGDEGGADPLGVRVTRATFAGGSSQTVTWNIAGTTAAPVSAASVTILLSTDGGTSFPTTLLANTPNDASAVVVIPNSATTTARIKIRAVGNIFFDVSDTDFTITATALTFTDDPLVPETTVVKAVHFQEMRDRINTLRTARMLGAFDFTDPVLTPGGTVISATHLAQLRTALDAVYTDDNLPLPTYTNNSVPSGALISALDITELRARIVARE